jgi:hypothetical protein
MSERRRLLDKLLRELARRETQAREHAPREARRLGDTPPVVALHAVALHAAMMEPRLAALLEAHGLATHEGVLGATFSTLRQLFADRVYDAERAYRGALLDLRHGLDVVRVLREVSRLEELFGMIRWCDDWLAARRTLVARVEAQLAWFADQPAPQVAADPGETKP